MTWITIPKDQVGKKINDVTVIQVLKEILWSINSCKVTQLIKLLLTISAIIFITYPKDCR